ncbi:F-box/LRR-repeat protein 10 [Raphanus sativus]|uniref:F-box/LRR-repeat protein 10 n=1 Tax=Raphanus sativus TaxID=3726 RepID=A0A9W3CIA0_RAPSA|nr:F-box/LRR-repeat protein 10 [Raphanus sativus]KAJ4876860.1 F-box/LRR-repeat protein 10 [Raphanus sativus]
MATTVVLDMLPAALLETIMTKLDVASLCSLASTCKTLKSCVTRVLTFAPNFHLFNVSLSIETVRPLLYQNQKLSSLKLDCGRLGNSAIDILARPSLREISLHNCRDFSGDLISQIGRKCKHLRSVCLGSVAEKVGRTITPAALEDLLNGCSHLEVLSLMFDLSLYLRPADARIFGLVSDKLTHLELGHISSRMITHLLLTSTETFQNLQQLRLSLDCITDAVVKAISKSLTSLIDLDLRDAPLEDPRQPSDLTDFGLQEINQNGGKLKRLSLIRSQEFHSAYFRRVSDQGMLFLAGKCSRMESICLGGFCRVTDAGFKTILHSCAGLSRFSVYHGPKLTDLVFHDVLATALTLSHVSLRRCHLLTDHAVRKLASNLNLESLDLRGCRNIRDEALRAVSQLTKLKVLLLDGTDVSDTGLSYLKEGVWESLVSLSVRGCRNLTDNFMTVLFDGSSKLALRELDVSNLPNLTDAAVFALAKSGAPITRLQLRECRLIGDPSVMALASTRVYEDGCPGSSLCLLDLYDCGGITQLSFKWLKKPFFPRLKWLGITGSVNRDIVDALGRRRPNLKVSCRGEELGIDGEDDWDSADIQQQHMEGEEDELQQWILGDEGDDDVEMEDESDDEASEEGGEEEED